MTSRFDYESAETIPASVPVFPISSALLLPRGTIPLNIFEPRYLAMVDDALSSNRLIGLIQPRAALMNQDAPESPEGRADLCDVGCLGRVTGFQETDDGRYLTTLCGISRFTVVEELEVLTLYRQCRIDMTDFTSDFNPLEGSAGVDRPRLLETFRAYLDANEMEADWPSVLKAETEALVNALSMMSPYGPREKQALLEAPDLKTRAEMLIAITEMTLHQGDGQTSDSLQ